MLIYQYNLSYTMHLKNYLFICICLLAFNGSLKADPIRFFVFHPDTLQKSNKNPKDSMILSKDSVAAKKKDSKKNDYEDLLKKGGTTHNGVFTVRHIEDNWYFEVPDSLVGRYFLAVTRLTATPQNFGKYAGEEVNEATVYFEKRDDKTMLLRAYVLSQYADGNDNISRTLQASTVDPIVASFKIIGKNPVAHMNLIDVTPLFKNDNKVMSFTEQSNKDLKLGSLQADRTFIDTLKTFPMNVEVVTTRTYGSSNTDLNASQTGFVTLGLNTSIVLLPKEPMRKRLWDNRIGYFTDRITYFSDDQLKADREEFIGRFKLVPKDLKRYKRGELVEPVKPIVFYIDPATPKKWIPYLIQGINDWQVAFEAAGFKNAIIGKECPPNDPNISVDDARYNFIRYLPAEIENAYGPHIVDPRSGETIESHVCWYHNVMNLLTKWYMTQCGPLDKRAQTMHFDDKLMGQLIRFVSSHEVGHTLGLRHNMGASHATPVEKLRDKAWVEKHGHTISIMDYARFNYVAQPEDGISAKGLFPRINDYDKWAIRWGYQYRPEFKDEFAEKEALMTETTKVLQENPQLWFGGEGRDEDPRAQTEDLGDDNVKASDYGIKNLQRVITNLPQWTKQSNGQLDDLREMYGSVRDQFRRYTNHVAKNIGGRYLNNLPGKKPFEVAPAAPQKAAVDYLARQLFDAPIWLYPTDITEKTGIDAVNTIIGEQNSILNLMLSVGTLNKIYDNSFDSQKAYQLPDYLNDVFQAVWRPMNDGAELKKTTRRSLERTFVELVNGLLNPKNDDDKSTSTTFVLIRQMAGLGSTQSSDATLYVEQLLDKVERYCQLQLASSKGINALHYQDLLRQVKLVKERRTTVR